MSKKLVNFRLKEEIWEEFQEKAEQEGKSASAQLRNLINCYLESDDQEQEQVQEQVNQLKNQLNQLEEQVEQVKGRGLFDLIF